MVPLINDKTVVCCHNAALATSTITGTYVDAAGYDYAELIVLSATAGTTTSFPASIALQHADDTATSSFATISGASATTSTTGYISAAPATSATTPIIRIGADLRGAKRYLRPSISGATVTNTSSITALIRLSRASQTPTGTNAGASVVISV